MQSMVKQDLDYGKNQNESGTIGVIVAAWAPPLPVSVIEVTPPALAKF